MPEINHTADNIETTETDSKGATAMVWTTYFTVAYWAYLVKELLFSPAVGDFDVLLNVPMVMNASFVAIMSMYCLHRGHFVFFFILYLGFLSTGAVL